MAFPGILLGLEQSPAPEADKHFMGASRSREIVGFLCRWSLLAATGTVAAVVAWASLLATVGLAGDLDSHLLPRDAVVLPSPPDGGMAYWRADLEPSPSRSGLPVGLLIAEGHPLGLVCTQPGGCSMVLDNPQAGTIPLRVRGAPYSAVAFQERRCQLLCVPAGRRVFLVDARMALAARRAQPDAWRDCLSAMKAAGQVALFHPGPWPRLRQCAEALRARGVDEPILFDDRRPDPTYTFQSVGKRLRRRHRREGIEVITADAQLARESGRERFCTHLVAEGASEAATGVPVRHHRSLANLKDFLSR